MPGTRALIGATVLSLLLSGVGVSAARADPAVTDLYVSASAATCSDTGAGSQAAPFCTIQSAADAAVAGQTVHIVASPGYNKPVVITRSGSPGLPITFDEDPYTSIRTPAGTGPLLTVSGAHDIVLRHLAMVSAGAPALAIVDSRDITFDSGATQVTNQVGTAASSQNSITVDGASHAIALTRLNVRSVVGTGIQVQPGARDVTIADDTFPDLPASAGRVQADGVSGLVLAADTFSVSCGTAVAITGQTTGSLENLDIHDTRSGPITCASPLIGLSASAEAAAGIHEDYNAVNLATGAGTAYDWAGTAYQASKGFNAATGQGIHDLDQNAPQVNWLVDSADADAPGEPPTDLDGNPRVDDPAVPNTGTGSGFVDRGAIEAQNPNVAPVVHLSVDNPLGSGPYPFTATLTASSDDTWATAPYVFDFGDGSGSYSSTSPTVQHTYTAPPADGSGTFTATVSRATSIGDGQVQESASVHGRANGSLAARVIPNPVLMNTPGTRIFTYQADTPWRIAKVQVDYGDGSAPESESSQDGTDSYATHLFAHPGHYVVNAVVTDAAGRSATVSTPVVIGSAFMPVAPQRFLDTRNGTGAPRQQAGPGATVRVKIAGQHGLPATVTAVTMNVTDTNATTAGYVTAYPDATARPTASNLNFAAGQTNPNQVTVPVGADGYVDLWNAQGHVDLIADVQGYFTTATTGDYAEAGYVSDLGQSRLLDTRHRIGTTSPNQTVGPGSTTTVTLPTILSSQVGDPSTVLVNVTATQTTGDGYVTVFPGTGARPIASDLNFRAGQTTSNLIAVPIDKTRTFKLYNSSARTALIVDFEGAYTNYFGAPEHPAYFPMAPLRLVDTRNGTGAPRHPLGPAANLRIKVAGTHGVPTDATAVTINLTGTNSTTTTYLTAYPGDTRPTVSNLNLTPGQTRPVLATVPLDSNGYITIYNNAGSTDTVLDLEGYFAPSS
ncbi:PKD domain-containing protein [Streptacidiphilus carbonis]|uniref:PKD domain-containing protein n=1 Tax=Streptacidiphilus carbonis TaxID=105422 RepID=UPI0005A83F8B|nr:PKD domain-containing protein [Streptacidiphilus carbonis]